MSWYEPNHREYVPYEADITSSRRHGKAGPTRSDRDIFHGKSKNPPASYSVTSKTLYEAPLSDKRKSLLPWRRRQQEKQEMEQALRTEQRLREEEKQQHRQQLEHERQIRAMMELEQNKKEAEARQRALAENDKKSKALADRHRREELEAQRKREIELKRMATSPEALQHLRELVRQRYELDMEIWQLRDVRKPDRPEVERRMYRADALLKEIQDIVKSWKMDAEVWTEGEGKVALEIRDRLLEDGKRIWRRQPPWAS